MSEGRRVTIAYFDANVSPATDVLATFQLAMPKTRVKLRLKAGLRRVTWTECVGSHVTQVGAGVTIAKRNSVPDSAQSRKLKSKLCVVFPTQVASAPGGPAFNRSCR